MPGEDLRVERGVHRWGDLDDRVHAVGRDGAHLGGDVLSPVVDDVVGAGTRREVPLLRAAHGGDDRGVGPPGELDRGIADRPGASGHQDGAAVHRARAQTCRTVLGHGQAPVRGQERHPEAGAEVERRDVRQQDHVAGRQDGVLLRGAAGGTEVGRLPDPHAQTQQAPPRRPDRRRRPPRSRPGSEPAAVGQRSPPGSPRRDFQSVGLTPERWMRTRTSPGPGSGTGPSTSVRTSGPPVREYSIERMPSTLSPQPSTAPQLGLAHRRSRSTEQRQFAEVASRSQEPDAPDFVQYFGDALNSQIRTCPAPRGGTTPGGTPSGRCRSAGVPGTLTQGTPGALSRAYEPRGHSVGSTKSRPDLRKCWAPPPGFEPGTRGLEGRCSVQLSYGGGGSELPSGQASGSRRCRSAGALTRGSVCLSPPYRHDYQATRPTGPSRSARWTVSTATVPA